MSTDTTPEMLVEFHTPAIMFMERAEWMHVTYASTYWLKLRGREDAVDVANTMDMAREYRAKPFNFAETTVVFRPLGERPLQVHLFHGRTHPGEELDDWGPDGPRFVACEAELRPRELLVTLTDGQVVIIPQVDDLHALDGMYYGDLEVCSCCPTTKGD